MLRYAFAISKYSSIYLSVLSGGLHRPLLDIQDRVAEVPVVLAHALLGGRGGHRLLRAGMAARPRAHYHAEDVP